MWKGKAGTQIPYCETPFQIIGKKVLECQHGPDRNKAVKKKYAQKKVNIIVINNNIINILCCIMHA